MSNEARSSTRPRPAPSNPSRSRRSRSSHPVEARRRYRCAIYTRKSSDEGLEQSFNSLDAQRDACEAYVTSQKHEGWIIIPDAYDDGGFSGGSMHRPALQRLLEDVSKGRIDIVVVYKVDRLTRSLADFAKLTELLDKHGASFVSVTQQFNTSTSMGRLTLNVLLSFAQFEREVAGERIRDKIALSKRRGMWMGGLPPLGYDGIDRQLVINEQEAETVRLIFSRYLEAGSIAELKRSLDQDGIVSKRRIFANGRTFGGVPISRGALYQILRNRLYRGEIVHRSEVHKGNHHPIIPEDLWEAVQTKLVEQSQRKRVGHGYGDSESQNSRRGAEAESKESVGGRHSHSGRGAGMHSSEMRSTRLQAVPALSLLTGLLFDEAGHRLTPTHALKNGKRYRYYVSAPLTRGEKVRNGIRIPAPDLEELVVKTIRCRLRDPVWLANVFDSIVAPQDMQSLITSAKTLARSLEGGGDPDARQSPKSYLDLIQHITVAKGNVTLALNRLHLAKVLHLMDNESPGGPTSDDFEVEPILIGIRAQFIRAGKQVRLILGEVTTQDRLPDPDLIWLIADAHRWFEDLRTGKAATIGEIAKRDRVPAVHISRTLPLAFLAPDIIEMILTGRQSPSLTSDRLKRRQSLPFLWSEQREVLLS